MTSHTPPDNYMIRSDYVSNAVLQSAAPETTPYWNRTRLAASVTGEVAALLVDGGEALAALDVLDELVADAQHAAVREAVGGLDGDIGRGLSDARGEARHPVRAGAERRSVDEHRHLVGPVAAHVEGELQTRGAANFVGYLKRPEAYIIYDDGWFRANVLRILEHDFDYAPCYVQSPALDKVCTTARELSLNEYDATVMYMMPPDGRKPVGTDTRLNRFSDTGPCSANGM